MRSDEEGLAKTVVWEMLRIPFRRFGSRGGPEWVRVPLAKGRKGRPGFGGGPQSFTYLPDPHTHLAFWLQRR